MKKDLMFLDNSFKSYICYKTRNFPTDELVKSGWDDAISRIERLCPSFSEGDYESIDVPISNLEYIGMGNIRTEFSEEQQKKLIMCFPDNELLRKSLWVVNEMPFLCEKFMNDLDVLFQETYSKIESFYTQELDIEKIIEKAENKLSTYPLHPHTFSIENNLRDWIGDLTEGKEGVAFKHLVRDLTWDTFIRHSWEEVDNKEHFIIKRLLAYYLDLKKDKQNLPGSILLAKLLQAMPFDEKKELLDPNLIEYAIMGYFDAETQKIRPVIVVSCDGKKQEERIIKHIQGIKRVNEILDRQALSFCHGYFIYLDKNDSSKDKVFDIKAYVDTECCIK